MAKKPIQIKFKNVQNQEAAFDIIKLEEIYLRKDLDHSPFDLHLVDFYIIMLVEEGKGSHTIDFIDHKQTKGTLLTIRKDQIHRFHKNSTVKGTLMLFTDEFLVSYLEEMETRKTLQLFNEILVSPKLQLSKKELEKISGLINRIKYEYFKTKDVYSLGIIRSELHILITQLFRLKSSKNDLITDKKYLKEFIELQDLVEKSVFEQTQVSYYAKELGCSTKTLNNITKSIAHKTAKEFIDDICIKQIKRLLINTKLSSTEIAYTAGFEETTNFYKYFKRHTQQTPEQFRSIH